MTTVFLECDRAMVRRFAVTLPSPMTGASSGV